MLSASPTAPDMSIRSSRYHENTVYQYISAYYKYIQGEGGGAFILTDASLIIRDLDINASSQH